MRLKSVEDYFDVYSAYELDRFKSNYKSNAEIRIKGMFSCPCYILPDNLVKMESAFTIRKINTTLLICLQ